MNFSECSTRSWILIFHSKQLNNQCWPKTFHYWNEGERHTSICTEERMPSLSQCSAACSWHGHYRTLLHQSKFIDDTNLLVWKWKHPEQWSKSSHIGTRINQPSDLRLERIWNDSSSWYSWSNGRSCLTKRMGRWEIGTNCSVGSFSFSIQSEKMQLVELIMLITLLVQQLGIVPTQIGTHSQLLVRFRWFSLWLSSPSHWSSSRLSF